MSSNRLRELRLERGFSQMKLAIAAHVSLRTITSIENGASCRLDTQRKLLRALGIPFENRTEVFPEAPK